MIKLIKIHVNFCPVVDLLANFIISESFLLRSRKRSPSPPFGKFPRGRGGGRNSPLHFRSSSPPEELTPEERDARTVFAMQLSQRIRARDLEEFFSSVGKVRDVRLIVCNKTRRFKGIAYIEFKDPESVALVSRIHFGFYYLACVFCFSILVSENFENIIV